MRHHAYDAYGASSNSAPFAGIIFLCITAYADFPNTCSQGDCKNGPGTASVYTKHGYQLGIYEGEFQEGVFHGKGTFTYESKESYVGEWKNNAADGQGIYFSADGEVELYNGGWRSDKRHGRGVAQPRVFDGPSYSGEYLEDKYHGNGELKELGTSYNGTFVKGKFEGQGRFVWPDGGSHIGGFKDGAISGFGVRLWATGATYRGGWKDGKMHGSGVYTALNGDESQQHWDNGIGRGEADVATPDFMDVTPKKPLGDEL